MLRGIGVESHVLPKPVAKTQPGELAGPSRSSLVGGFGEQLEEAAKLVAKAETSASSMASGSEGSVETVLALSRAELALRHVVSVRNRLLESYKEVMNLPL